MMEENLPPGFRFHPTDEELITHYLSHKVSDLSFTCKAIVDVDLNKCEPWDLPGKASMGEKKWYFFNLRDRKYPTGLRTNRATKAGYWKTTGNDREIQRAGSLVGMKKTLVFYKGRAPKGVKSDWVMHEYRLQNKHFFKPSKGEWVVCRVFQKSAAVKKPQATSSSQPSPRHANSMVNEFGDRVELQNLIINANNPSSSELISIATPSYCNYSTVNNHGDDHMNMMNLNTSCLPSWLTWPSSITLNPNLSMNSVLLKALQLKNYQPRDVNFETGGQSSSSFQGIASSSSSKVLEYPMPPPQQNQQQVQEKPFNVDSIW